MEDEKDHSLTVPLFPFADATRRVGSSAIRELSGLLNRPDIISLAGGFAAQEAHDLDGLLRATRRALSHTATAAFLYGESAGYRPLRELIAQREAERGLKLDPLRLMITSGSQQAIYLTARALIDPGDPVFVEAPSSFGALQALRLHGANVVPVLTDREGIVIDALETALDRYQPKMLYLMPNFANPTGRVLSLQRRNAILALASRHRFFVVEDNSYGELYFREPPPPSLLALARDSEREWVVHLASLSKYVAPGLRLGWMTSPASLFTHLAAVTQVDNTHPADLSQLVAFHYLNAGSLESVLSRMRIRYHKQAQAMHRSIETELADTALRVKPPVGGMFIWADVPGIDTAVLLTKAISRGVTYVPGTHFYCSDAPSSQLRLSLSSALPNQIGAGIRRLGQVLREADRGTQLNQPRTNRARAEQLP